MGKPYLRDGGPSFSLTHCRGLAACAVTRAHSMRRIGVDAEPLSSARKLESIIDDFANTREREWLRRQGRPLALVLVELWTAKEAVLKARGTGLATADGEDALQTIHCEFLERTDCDATRFAVEDEYTIHCWQLASGHVLSLAVSPPQDDEAPLMPQEHDLGASASSGTTTPSQ
jgi:phosphopantetheinyl transferase